MVEDAAAQQRPLAMRYLTVSRGEESHRHASVHLVDVGPPVRFVATCHRSGELRWFRVDNILRAHLDANEPFRAATDNDVHAFRAASLDGFKGNSAAAERFFFVRRPECAWVKKNLLPGMRVEDTREGIRVTLETSAIVQVARFVVALGEAAWTEDETLRKVVAGLAWGAWTRARGELAAAAPDPDA